MSAAKKTPSYILAKLRQRQGLDSTDVSEDARLNALDPMDKLREVLAWEMGDGRWADQFLTWAKDCGIKMDDPR